MSRRPPIEVVVWNKHHKVFATAFTKGCETHPADDSVFKYPGGDFTRRSTRVYQRDMNMELKRIATVAPPTYLLPN